MLRYAKRVIIVALALLPLFLVAQILLVSSSYPATTLNNNISSTHDISLKSALSLWQKQQHQAALNVLLQLDPSFTNDVNLYQFYFDVHLNSSMRDVFANKQQLSSRCKQQLLFVTGNVFSLTQAHKFSQLFTQDQRLRSLPICTQPIIWFEPEYVHCLQYQEQNGRINCDLLLLAPRLKEQQFTHLVVFAEEGKANVHNGVMFLDRKDTYDVFVHELAHFSGFIDEYPLGGQLAQQTCKGIDAPNLVFRTATDTLTNTQYWQSNDIHQQAVLSKARTCDNHSTQAYKASDKLTFMEYHDVAYIPQSYLAAWQKRLLEPHNSTPAHINFAQHYEEHNNVDEAQFWRLRYQAYLGHK